MGLSIDLSEKKKCVKSVTQIMAVGGTGTVTPAWVTAIHPPVVILTEFGRHDGHIVLGDVLPVEEFVGGNRSLHRVDVEVAVHVALPVDGIPAKIYIFAQ